MVWFGSVPQLFCYCCYGFPLVYNILRNCILIAHYGQLCTLTKKQYLNKELWIFNTLIFCDWGYWISYSTPIIFFCSHSDPSLIGSVTSCSIIMWPRLPKFESWQLRSRNGDNIRDFPRDFLRSQTWINYNTGRNVVAIASGYKPEKCPSGKRMWSQI